MWLSRRKTLIALSALFAGTGCGFTPVYAPQGAGARLDDIRVKTPGTRAGFLLRQRLEERLGRVDRGRYDLQVTPSVTEQGLATDSGGRTNRFRLIGAARYRLADAQSGAGLLSGQVTGFTGYSATGSTVATLAAERDALARLMMILADGVVDKLLLAADDLPE